MHRFALRVVALYVLLVLAVRAAVWQPPGSVPRLLLLGTSGVLALAFLWTVVQIPTVRAQLPEEYDSFFE